MNTNNPPKFIEISIDNQVDTFDHIEKLRAFVFRGHRDAAWEIESSFQREYKKYPSAQTIEGAENNSIEYFKRRIHSHQIGINSDSRKSDLLSAMQHYGCPTRLIDFTNSYYVATYFSVNLHKDNALSDSYAVWAINFPVLKEKSKEIKNSNRNMHFMLCPENELINLAFQVQHPIPKAVVPIDVSTISKRMSSQQGVLLAQLDLRSSFMANLCQMLRVENSSEKIDFEEFKEINQNIINDVYIIKFIFKDRHIQNVRRRLLNLNTVSEVLFPDIHGLARSSVEHVFWQY